jgi:choline dehydrogenase
MKQIEPETFDFVIVGAGSAGCVLADKLTRCGRYTVAIVEAGGANSSWKIQIPAAVVFALGNPEFDWNFSTEPDPSRNDRTDIWPRGRGLGGSSAINGLFFVRGDKSDFDGWAELGNRGWAFDDVLPYFREIEQYRDCGDDSQTRGVDGPLSVGEIRSPHILSKAFVEAAVDAGIPRSRDYNCGYIDGVAIAQTTDRRGWRCSAAKAFLHPAQSRKNLTIKKDTRAIGLNIDNSRVDSISCKGKIGDQKLVARREIILSAGSIGTPHLLMHSGIGPCQMLNQCGIPVRLDCPGVGKNLQEHCGVWIIQDVREGIRTANMDYGSWRSAVHGLRFLLTGTGPVASPTAQAMLFARTHDGAISPDVQVHFMPMGYSLKNNNMEVLGSPAMMAVPSITKPKSRGSLTIRSPDPLDKPLIEPRLLSAKEDMSSLISGCRLVRKIFSSPSLGSFSRGELSPGSQVESDEDWEQVLRESAGPIYHVVGTCKMGTDEDAVVDNRLRVRGVDGLRIVDSSIMPTITSGNTNAPTMMIAAKAADIILQEAL